MIRQIFLAHPAAVDESYGAHLMFALHFSGVLLVASGAALIHALVPCLFEKAASRMVARLYARTAGRGAPPAM